MIKKIVMYQCGYCNNYFTTEKEAIDCLNSHEIVFGIESLTGGHDCWGSRTAEWKKIGLYFKNYKSALSYCKTHGDDYRMYIMELVDSNVK